MLQTFLVSLIASSVAGYKVPAVAPSFIGANPMSPPHGRIVGGKPTSIEQYPWQVSVQVLGFHSCGGSILSENIVLTAGHCTSYKTAWLSVRVGSSVKHVGGTVHRVDEAVRHEGFSMNDLGVPVNDVSILKLRTPISISDISRPVTLFHQNEEAAAGVLSTVTGWGALEEGGKSPEVLYAVDVPIVGKSVCDKAYESQGGISPGQICAAHPDGGKDTCQGDSGGPLVINGRQVGIVSYGVGCARKGFPGVYTEIAYFHDWIVENAGI